MTLEALRDELRAAGYAWEEPADWGIMETAVSRLREFPAADSDSEGNLVIASGLTSLIRKLERSSVPRFRALLSDLAHTDFVAESTKRLAQADLPALGVLKQHAGVLGDAFPLGADVVTLARMAALESCTLGEALAILYRYRPLIEPRWMLPDHLPPLIAGRDLSPAERALLVDTNVGNDESRDWAELLVQASVTSGLPLADIVNDVLPLLTETGVPLDDLRRLSEAWPGPVTFDDLLILGCLQTWLDFTAEEIRAITRPFCRFPEELPARVTHWLQHADAWTARSQRRQGRAGTDPPSPGDW